MEGVLTVNEALERLASLAGKTVAVRGILHYEFEEIAIWHYPKIERNDFDLPSAIWLGTGTGSLQFNPRGMEKLDRHRVIVLGTLYAPNPHLGGCGHMSALPAEILVSSIDRV